LLRAALGLDPNQAETAIFRERAMAFLVDNERGKNIAVRLGDRIYSAGTSEANGHFSTTLQFTAAEADRLRRGAADREGWLGFRAVTRPGDDRTFAGRVQWIAPEGRSVISDIDDTIKISNVQDREALVANTFLREFRPVPGMAPLYRKWADAGVAFHYVSGSPWQLHELLAEFCRSEGFPAGSFHMKLFRLKDSSALSFFGSQEGYKTEVIEKILADFPRRNFTLLGDSGEQDPEIYAAAARKHPEQIQYVFIRNAGGRGSEPARFQKAFEGIPAARWKVFEKPDELPENL
jgi:phosphatidate phosphatase APP1